MKPESHDYPEKGFPNHPIQDYLPIPQLLPQWFALGLSQFLLSLTSQFSSLFVLSASTSFTWKPLLCLSRFSANQGVWSHPPEGGWDGVTSLYKCWSWWAGIPMKWGSQQCFISAFVLEICFENCCQDSKLLDLWLVIPRTLEYWRKCRVWEAWCSLSQTLSNHVVMCFAPSDKKLTKWKWLPGSRPYYRQDSHHVFL